MWAFIGGAAVFGGGCQTPFESPGERPGLEETVAAAVDREIASISEDAPTLRTMQPRSEVEEALAERREELEQIGPIPEANPEADWVKAITLGSDLTGAEQAVVSLDLHESITSAVRNNLAVRIASLEPAITREDIINAEAAFDFVLFGDFNFTKTDEPQASRAQESEAFSSFFGPLFEALGAQMPASGAGFEVGLPVNASEVFRFETGVRKRFRFGGELGASTDVTRFGNQTPGLTVNPDPSYTAAVRLRFTQPLLRGFGEDVNTATIRLAGNAQSRAVAQLRGDLLNTVEQVDRAYWDLLLAWRNLEIQQWLVDVGDDVRDKLYKRRDFDTKMAQYTDAVAKVEQRKAEVIRARRAVRAASDALKTLMNDAELTVGSEAVLKPSDPFANLPIDYNLRQILGAALANRPEIEQALLGIDDATVARLLAGNARLPLLNLSAEAASLGLAGGTRDAYDGAFETDFVDYLLALTFEYPFGNRAAEAAYRKTRLQRSQAFLAYRQAVQSVVLDVKAALRDVVTNYELIQATRSFRIAQAENLRALEVEEDTLAGLTPEFLNLKFQRQDTLAAARRQEIQAMANYEQSLASLYRAMGTGLTMHDIDMEFVEESAAGGESMAPDGEDR